MTDQELLELAAKAAGYARIDFLSFEFDNRANVYDERDRHDNWNPLADDGDALRLAVQLGIDVFPWQNKTHDERTIGIEAATRRAIVRAAAEIGRRME
jgi:hypothetical protein